MHPDRFSQTRQKAEWDLANEMLKELNQAYGALKDPVERSIYDRSMGGNASQANYSTPPPQPSNSQPPPQKSSPPRPQPTYTPPPQKSSSSVPRLIYTLVFMGIIGLLSKGCDSLKNIAPSTPSNLSAVANHTPASYSTTAPSLAPLPKRVASRITVPSDYPEPANGFVFKNSMNSGHGTLKISNGCPTHSVVKLVDTSANASVYAVFVRANSEFKITGIPDGTYRLLFASGHGWDDLDGRFREREGSSEFDSPLVYTTEKRTQSDGIYTYYHDMELTLNPVKGGNAQTKDVTASEFEKY